MRSSCCLVSPSLPEVTNAVCVVADVVGIDVTQDVDDDGDDETEDIDAGIVARDNEVNGDDVEEEEEDTDEEDEDDENVEVVEPVEELRGEDGFDFSPFIVYCIHDAEAPGELASPVNSKREYKYIKQEIRQYI